MEVPPLTPIQRRFVWIAAVAVGVTRILALSRTPWDWDEALFMSAMREYDVAEHQPHPPGFPLYIALARLFGLFFTSDFDALRAINLIAALLAFPLLFALARELRFDFITSWLAALLFVFLPNVWFFGGTGFSDVPAVVIAVGAATLLLRGRRSGRSFVIGCAVAAFGMGMRPQNALLAAYPILAASWAAFRARRYRDIATGALTGAVILAAAFGGAIWATGSWGRYRAATEAHRQYITTVDSYLSPVRPSLERLVDDFYIYAVGVRPEGGELAGAEAPLIVAALALLGALRARRPALETIAIFGPFAIFALFMLDFLSASRFSIAYMPLFALLAAEGARLVGSAVARGAALVVSPAPSLGRGVQAFLIAGVAAYLAVWASPAIRTAATTRAPTYAAMEWVRKTLDPAATRLWVHGSMMPFARYYLHDYPYEVFDGDPPLARIGDARGHWIVSEGLAVAQPAVTFRRDRGRLWKIVRRRYFETHARPLTTQIRFEDGWYGAESDARAAWRWMGRDSRAILPGLSGDAVLRLDFSVPVEAIGTAPEVTILLNDTVLDRFEADENAMSRSYRVSARERENELRITLDRVVNPARAGLSEDARDLGLRLDAIHWTAAEQSAERTRGVSSLPPLSSLIRHELDRLWEPRPYALAVLHRR